MLREQGRGKGTGTAHLSDLQTVLSGAAHRKPAATYGPLAQKARPLPEALTSSSRLGSGCAEPLLHKPGGPGTGTAPCPPAQLWCWAGVAMTRNPGLPSGDSEDFPWALPLLPAVVGPETHSSQAPRSPGCGYHHRPAPPSLESSGPPLPSVECLFGSNGYVCNLEKGLLLHKVTMIQKPFSCSPQSP